MDVELGKLIEKLKAEGVEEGRRVGRERIEAAEKEAAARLEQARAEAADIRQKAEMQAADFKAKSETAVRQAARDVQLLLKSRILELFERAFRAETAAALEPGLIRDLILKVAEGWSASEGIEVILSDQDRTAAEALIRAGLGRELQAGVVLKTDPAVRHGFRIARRGRDIYFDFTDESLSEALFSLLKPHLRALLAGSNQ
jgi:V/A-type H+/Na+-transporting ATPase subunit E